MTNRPTNPFKGQDFNEGSTVFLELTNLNKNKVLAAPTTLQYRLDDLTNAREVTDWTTVATPATTNTIELTPTQNTLNGRGQKKELRQVTTKTTDSSGSVVQVIFTYNLVRIFNKQDQLS